MGGGWAFSIEFFFGYYPRQVLPRTTEKSSRPHTAAKSEIAVTHIPILLHDSTLVQTNVSLLQSMFHFYRASAINTCTVIYTCLYIYMCIYMYLYIYICVCFYILGRTYETEKMMQKTNTVYCSGYSGEINVYMYIYINIYI